MSKTIKIGGRIESAERGGVVTGANAILDDTKGKKQNVINSETDDELARLDNAKQDVLTFDNAPTENSANPVKSGGVYAADAVLQQAIEAILQLIPSAATALNQLADKAFVNSTVATNTATFRGTYNVVTDLSLHYNSTHQEIATALLSVVQTADNNDYCFVQIPVSDSSGDIRVTERYKFNGTEWSYEYDLNNSGFTADQWAAINSTITLALVQKLGALPTAAELAQQLALKQNTLTFDTAPVAGSSNPVTSGGLYNVIAAINATIPSGASVDNKLVAESRLTQYVAAIVNALDATFNVTSTDGHVNVRLTQVDGVITSVEVITNDIASASELNTLAGRVTTNEGDISAEVSRATQAEADLRALYNALQQSAPVIIQPTDTWPVASPSATVIYRVIDRVNTPPQYYSDYMFSASDLTPVLMATYNNAIDPRPKKGSQNLVTSGGVFDNMGALDVSELNATENPHTLATYADLSTALAAIPSDYQKGGMSIKFVQSSDNKYVQYRLMSNQFSTTVTDWQGVDDEPTAGSDNLVKSDGVKKEITPIENLTYALTHANISSDYDYVQQSTNKDVLFDWGVNAGDTIVRTSAEYPNEGAFIIGLTLDGEIEILPSDIFEKRVEAVVAKDYAKVGLRIRANNGSVLFNLSRVVNYDTIHNITERVESLEADRYFYKDIIKEVTTVQQSTQQTIWLGVSVKEGQHLIVNGTSGVSGTRLKGKKSDNTEVWLGSEYNFEGWNNQRVDIAEDFIDIGFWSNGDNPSVSVTITIVSNLGDVERRLDVIDNLLPVTDIDSFNFVKNNRERISLFLGMYKLKAVDKTNRLVVSFNGDSIIGSQLDNITKSDEYLTGAFPPNMSKMIMARQFLDDYQFDDADVVYRNIIHSDWVKSSGAFEISNGKDEPTKTFNEIEVYGTANVGDSAEIIVTGYKFFKLIWSEYDNTSKFQVLYSLNGSAYTPWDDSAILPEYIEVTANSRCMQKYAVLTLNPNDTYKFKIIATENPNNILFWGCEMWNNPRLDVVVEAFSGSRAIWQVKTGQLEAYHSDWHTPALVVSDIFSINDYAYIVGSDETIDQWMTSNKTLYNRVIDNGIALLLFTPWQSTNYLTKNAVNVARQNNLPYIDIQKKQTVLLPSSAIYGPDGTHLSDYGNTYFYDELKRVLNDE